MDQQRVWRRKGKAYDKKCTISTVKHESGFVLLGVCLPAAENGKLNRVTCIVDSLKHQDILKK